MKEMEHKEWIDNYEDDFEKLTSEIGDLKYDALEIFLSLLSEKIAEDAMKDKARGRDKLGNSLENCAHNLKEASRNIQNAWIICEPYMPLNEDSKNK